MKKLIYTPDAFEKIQELDYYLSINFGKKEASNIKKTIQKQIKSLKFSPYIGISVKDMYGIETDYRKLFVCHNHVFYRVEEDCIRIINVFNEHEDFIVKLFGIQFNEENEE